MKGSSLRSNLLLLTSLFVLQSVQAAAQTTPHFWADLAPPSGEEPLKVQLEFRLYHLNKIDEEAETYNISGVLTLRWQDPRQAFDPAIVGAAEKVFSGNFQFNEVSPGWYPQVVLVDAVGLPDSQGVVFQIQPDGTSRLTQHVHATLRTQLNLRRYPFDKQELLLPLELLGFPADQAFMALEPGDALIDREIIRVPEWRMTGVRVRAPDDVAVRGVSGAANSAVELHIEVERQSFYMVRLVLGPLALVVFLSWAVFWMDRSSLGDRMAVSFVGILTAVAYQSMVGDIMPNTAYITFLNAFIVMSTLLMSGTVLVNLVVASCDEHGNYELGTRIDKTCRWLFPLLYVLLVSLSAAVTFSIE